MSRWCSVIIPTLNEEATLAAAIHSLGTDWPPGGVEVIVADGGSTDKTLEVARSQGAKIVVTQAGRARQLNAGARVASGQFLYFLHADTLAPPLLARHLRAAALRPAAACCYLRFDRQRGWLRVFSWLSRWNLDAFRFGDQSLFVSRTLFERAGGYREDHELLEGHELVKRLRKLADGFTIMPAAVTTSARRYRQHGVVYTQLVFVLIMLLYWLGTSQRRLTALYRRAFHSPTKEGVARNSSASVHSNIK